MSSLSCYYVIIGLTSKGGDRMGKKFQVVLPAWMEDYLQNICDEYDLTISELLSRPKPLSVPLSRFIRCDAILKPSENR